MCTKRSKGSVKEMNIAIITGASSGIGMEFALQMDLCFKNIDEFWLVARRGDKLKELSRSLQHPTKIFEADITEDAQIEAIATKARKENAVVRILVNCAGFGIMGEFAGQDLSSQAGMIRLNCEALTKMTHSMLPYMRKGSRILQMASSAAFLPQPDFAVYAASKSYVLSFSRALGEELKERGIYVTSVCPGPVDTPFFDIAEKTGSTLAIKKYTMVDAKRVVCRALLDSYRKKSISVCSLPMQGFFVMTKVLPHDVLLKGMTLLKQMERRLK